MDRDLSGIHGEPVMELARILYEKMEHLDPGSGGGSPWEELPERDMHFYAICVEAIIDQSTLVRRALANNDMVDRHA
jgi:hypothetical protein